MEVFKPIKIENYQFMDSGLDQYEPLLLYIKDDVEEGKVYFVKNKFDDKLREWVEENLRIYGKDRIVIDRGYGEVNIDVFTQDLEDSIDRCGYAATDLEKRIEKLEEGFRKIELKNRSKSGEIYDLMERVRQLNKDTIWIVVDDPTKVKYNKRQENSRKQ